MHIKGPSISEDEGLAFVVVQDQREKLSQDNVHDDSIYEKRDNGRNINAAERWNKPTEDRKVWVD